MYRCAGGTVDLEWGAHKSSFWDALMVAVRETD